MGRSTPTYRDALRAIADRWERYRRALRRVDQPRFDRLIGIALEQERRLDDLEERVEALEEHFDSGVGAEDRETAEVNERELVAQRRLNDGLSFIRGRLRIVASTRANVPRRRSRRCLSISSRTTFALI